MLRPAYVFLALANALLAGAGPLQQASPASQTAPSPVSASVTFDKDIAPLLWENCANCHREGQLAPFSLLTYEDVRPRADEILRAVQRRKMPPWKPEPGYGEFDGSRRLSDEQVSLLERWVQQGSPRGNPHDLPPAPTFTDGWYGGEPDLVVTMPEPFEVPANGLDIFRTFVVPIPVTSRKYVKALEFQSRNPRVVHHANIKIDPTPLSRLLDEEDPGVGTTGSGSRKAVFPDGYFLGWTPGQRPRVSPGSGMAWRLDPNSDLIIEIHMIPIATTQYVQARVGLYFTDEPPTRSAYMLRIGRQDIDIPAGAPYWVNTDSYTLPVDVDVLGVQPHAHYFGKEIHGYATLPDGSIKQLIYVKDWDFHWQDVYQFSKPVSLPKGSVLTMHYTYDNSTKNQYPDPKAEPKRVIFGQKYGSEMGTLWIQVLPHSAADLEKLDRDFAPKLLADDIAGNEKILELNPDDARFHAELADCYLEGGRLEDALQQLTRAEALEPTPFRHYDVGRLLLRMGRLPEAGSAFHRALAQRPDMPESLYGLGLTFDGLGRFDEAADAYERALRLNLDFPDAHFNLARILAAQGRIDEAIAHYRQVLQLQPGDAEAIAALERLKTQK
jgi:mono/diheme cytochrome c family protein